MKRNLCPKCGSDNFLIDYLDNDLFTSITRNCRCCNCKQEWETVFHFYENHVFGEEKEDKEELSNLIKSRTFSAEEIATIIEQCSTKKCKEDSCPLFAECLFYYAGDDTLLKERENE